MAMPSLLFAGLRTAAANASSALRNYFRGWSFMTQVLRKCSLIPLLGLGALIRLIPPGQPPTNSLPQTGEHLHQPSYLGAGSFPPNRPENNVGNFTNGLQSGPDTGLEVQNLLTRLRDLEQQNAALVQDPASEKL
eukprot:1087364-Pelagomonas_calceolata.AAC.1